MIPTALQLNFQNTYGNFGVVIGNQYQNPVESLSSIPDLANEPVSPQSMAAGYIGNDLFSANYKSGVSGWKLTKDGDFEGNNGTFRGNIILGTSSFIEAGQTAYNTGVGFFLGYSGGAYKLSVGDPSGKYLNWNGSDFNVNGFVLSSIPVFGGDGSDGALNISGATNLVIDCSGLPFLIKNYTSISITGGAYVSFINPAAGGTIIIFKSQSDVVITSNNAVGAISVKNMGGDKGTGGQPDTSGTDGTKGNLIFGDESAQGKGGVNQVPGTPQTTGGSALTIKGLYSIEEYIRLTRKSFVLACGSGGGGGGGGSGLGSVGGDGGKGAGILMIECGGALNFGAGASIIANGADGSNGIDSAGGYGSAGGGGGATGMVLILYKTLTANNGVIYASGGKGGNGGATLNAPPGGSTAGSGGSGAGGYGGNGGYGGASTSAGQDGQSSGSGGGGGGSRGFMGGSTLGGAGGTSINCIIATNYNLV